MRMVLFIRTPEECAMPHQSLAKYAFDNVAEVYRMYGEPEADRVAHSWQRTIALDAEAALEAAKAPPAHSTTPDSITER
jgi:hypothetical protein